MQSLIGVGVLPLPGQSACLIKGSQSLLIITSVIAGIADVGPDRLHVGTPAEPRHRERQRLLVGGQGAAILADALSRHPQIDQAVEEQLLPLAIGELAGKPHRLRPMEERFRI